MRFEPALSFSLLTLACAGHAQAQVITFNTEVIQVACTPDLNHSGAPSATITLNDVKVSDFANAVGATAGETPFAIALSACGDRLPAGTVAGAYFYAYKAYRPDLNGSRYVYDGRLLGTSTDGGAGWHYQLLPGSGGDEQLSVLTSDVKPPAAVLAQLPRVDVSSGSGTLNYRVRYYRAPTTSGGSPTKTPMQINPGTRTAQATYVLYYQ